MNHVEAVGPRRRCRAVLQLLLLVSLNGLATSSATAQSAPSPGAVPASRGPLFAVRPTLSVGGSVLWFDAGGDDASRGLAVRGGVALGPIAELTVGAERWPDLGPYSAWSLQAEGSIYPLGRRRIGPYVLLHLGHFRGTLPPGSIYTRERVGRTRALALGFHVRVWDPLGARLEYAVRYEPGGANEQLRVFVTYAPGLRQLGLGPAEVAAVVYGMVRASGPWHFVEPAYALKFATRMTARDAAALTIGVLHWQISEPRRTLAPYLWDTRAVLVMPAWRRGTSQGDVRWYAQAGPSVSLMLEGPDYGLRGGANAELGGSLRLGPLPMLTGGIGWIWIVRGVSGPSIPPTDQHGLLFHAGVAF